MVSGEHIEYPLIVGY